MKLKLKVKMNKKEMGIIFSLYIISRCIELKIWHRVHMFTSTQVMFQQVIVAVCECKFSNFWRKCVRKSGNNHCGKKSYADGTNCAF